MSVTEDDLPTVETPTSPNVSPLDSLSVDSQSQHIPAKPEGDQRGAAPSPSMPIIKVQPFIHGEVTCLSVSQSEASSSSALRFDFGLSLTSSLRKQKNCFVEIVFFMSQQKTSLSRAGSPGCCLIVAIYWWCCASPWLLFSPWASASVVSSYFQ